MGYVSDRTQKLEDIKQAQKEANQSEWNTSSVAPQQLDSYNKWSQEYLQSKASEKYGLSDAEKSLALNTNAQNMNFAQQNALRAGGGNASSYISGVLNAGQNQEGLELASRDAEVQRQKRMQTLSSLEGLNRSAGVFQDVNNLNFQKQMATEQALGQAESDWYSNRAADRRATIGLVGSVLGSAATIGAAAATGGASTAAGAGAAAAASDIRLKKNIIYSHTENGHKIYEFEYINEPNTKYSGVMAQEVIKTHPSAVIEEDGYYKVNYDMLGLTMKKIN
jgi:hypothetical protein